MSIERQPQLRLREKGSVLSHALPPADPPSSRSPTHFSKNKIK